MPGIISISILRFFAELNDPRQTAKAFILPSELSRRSHVLLGSVEHFHERNALAVAHPDPHYGLSPGPYLRVLATGGQQQRAQAQQQNQGARPATHAAFPVKCGRRRARRR